MSSSSTISFAHSVIIAVMVVALDSSSLNADARRDVVRVLHPALTKTLDDVYAASPSARKLIDRLERSDLLIHVVGMGMKHRRPFTGTMRFVVRAGGRRLLRITVDERLAADRRAAALAHELQHAEEVADAAFVVDHASFAALYREIGHESGDDSNANCFETVAAIRAGTRVLAEFRAAASSARHEARATVSAGRGK
jgi:hypothetical protein